MTKLVAANNAFGFQLLARVARGETGKNVALSPVALTFALNLAYNGAGGDTRQAMASVLGVEGVTLEDLNRTNASLRSVLVRPDAHVRSIVATSLWARGGLTFAPKFLERDRGSYRAYIGSLRADVADVARVNIWVREASESTLERMVEFVKPEASLLLASLAVFRGTWATSFEADKTKEVEFALADGKQAKQVVMFQSGHYAYLRGPTFQAVRLLYGEGRLGMVVFLPDRGASLATFLGSLDYESWKSWIRAFETKQGVVILPRFSIECETDLVPALRDLGMQAAVDPRHADFAALCTGAPRPALGQVEHKTAVEVTELGLAVAAKTPAWTILGQPRSTFRMIMDHPFFWAIHDKETDAVLAMGTFVVPE